MFRSLRASLCCMVLACAVPSAVIAADACYLPQSAACYVSLSQPAACYPLQSGIFGAGTKDDIFAFMASGNPPFADEVKSSQFTQEQTVACTVPHAEIDANIAAKQRKL